MTPELLRRGATQLEVEAADLVSDATRLRSHASGLEGLLAPLIPMSKRVWRGPAADDFEGQVRGHADRVDRQARALEDVAGDFERLAATKRSEAEQLRAQAAAAEQGVATGGWWE